VIDFTLSDELALLRDTARGFARDHLRDAEREAEAARAPSGAARAAYRAIGLAELELPEALGGAGLGALARALVQEELAAADPGAALALDPLGPALYALAELGGEAALRHFALPLLERDGARAALACDLDGRVRARADGVAGELPWVAADRPDLLVVLGRDGGIALVEGFACEPLRGAGLRAAGAAQVALDAAAPAAVWRDADGAARALARARLHLAALLVGTLRAASEFARDYARQRVAFGRPIAHHQALAFLLVDMHAAVEGCRALLHDAAWRLDAGEDAREACATAFLEAAEQALFVAPNAVQVLGGHGFMQDYPVEKWMREARALGLLAGGVDAAREDAGLELAAREIPLPLTLGEPARAPEA
jgi:alkylation response protein AidB-like acyl-CoA dehydrogenase